MIFFFNDTATTEIYTLSLHDALPIWRRAPERRARGVLESRPATRTAAPGRSARRFIRGSGLRDAIDRKSTRLNSSHANISYAVFCLKKKTLFISTFARHLTSSFPIPV